MAKNPFFQQTLDDNQSVEQLLIETLQIPKRDAAKVIANIRDCNILLKKFNESKSDGTINDISLRAYNYKTEESRWKLREQIVDELYMHKRLEKDDRIKISKGGALPNAQIKNESRAFIVTGLPASGKSGLSEKIADEVGAIILDSDYAKRKLPEYNDNIGASYVHKESKNIVFGFSNQPTSFKNLLELCSNDHNNIVIPIIGDTLDSILDLYKLLKIWGYSINILHLSIDKYEATRRAVYRFKDSKRYVPIDKIFNTYADNNPTLTYYKLRVHHSKKFQSFCLLSADVKKGEKYELLDNKKALYIKNILR